MKPVEGLPKSYYVTLYRKTRRKTARPRDHEALAYLESLSRDAWDRAWLAELWCPSGPWAWTIWATRSSGESVLPEAHSMAYRFRNRTHAEVRERAQVGGTTVFLPMSGRPVGNPTPQPVDSQ